MQRDYSVDQETYWRAEARSALLEAGLPNPSEEVVEATIRLLQTLQWRTDFVWP